MVIKPDIVNRSYGYVRWPKTCTSAVSITDGDSIARELIDLPRSFNPTVEVAEIGQSQMATYRAGGHGLGIIVEL